jgi:hypothetical protein
VGFGGSLCSYRPLQSLAEQQGDTAHAAPLPWSSPEAGLGTLPKIALQCSFHAAKRSGSFGLPRVLPGLTTDSACAGLRRTLEVFRIASSTNQHCCSLIIDPLFGSPSELLPAARTGSRRPPLLGSDRRAGCPERLAHPPLRQLCTFFRRTVARPLPATNRGPSPSASGYQSGSPVPTAWYLTTSPVFSAQRLAGLLHPAADPGVRHVSHGPAEASRDPRDATTPRRIFPPTRGTPVSRSPGPPGVRPRGIRTGASLLTHRIGSLRDRHLRGFIRADGL